MNIESETLSIPDTDYNAVVSMPSSDFQKVCRDLTIFGDAVSISVAKGSVHFATSGDLGKGVVEHKQSAAVDTKSEDATTITITEPVSLSFALRYLNFFTKATSLSNNVALSLSPQVPVMIEYPIPDIGYVRYYLAPKIDDSTDE